MNDFAPVIKEMKYAYDAAKQQDELSDEDESIDSAVTEPNENAKKNDSDGKTGEGLIDDLMFEVKEIKQTDKPLTTKISTLLGGVLATGLNEQSLNARLEKIRRPENCKLLRVTKVNSEIWDIAQKNTRSMDVRLQKLQEMLTKGLTPLARVAGVVGEALSTKGELPLSLDDLWEGLSSSVLIASANHNLNMCRRDLFKADLDEKYKALCSNKEPVSQQLFGDDLGERLKTVKKSKKAAQQLTGNKRERDEQYPKSSYKRSNFLYNRRGRQGRPQKRYRYNNNNNNNTFNPSTTQGSKSAKQK